MAVIALSMELGTPGEQLAAGIAERLGLEIVDHRRFERDIAERLDAEDGEGVRQLANLRAPSWGRWGLTRRQLSRHIAEEILDVAARGNVLLIGSAAAVALRPFRHVLSVRVRAPLEIRERNVMRCLAYDDARVARWEIESTDWVHSRFVRHLFDADRQSPDLYDVVLNLEQISLIQCAVLVCLLARGSQFEETPAACEELATRLRALQSEEADEAMPEGEALRNGLGTVTVT